MNRNDPALLFSLRVSTSEGAIMIYAYEAYTMQPNHTKIDILVRMNGRDVFPRGALYVGIPAHHSIDGIYAKEAVMSCVAMKPGDTDASYFDGYTQAQLEFAETFGDLLGSERDIRYCDPQTGCFRT